MSMTPLLSKIWVDSQAYYVDEIIEEPNLFYLFFIQDKIIKIKHSSVCTYAI